MAGVAGDGDEGSSRVATEDRDGGVDNGNDNVIMGEARATGTATTQGQPQATARAVVLGRCRRWG